MAFEDLDVWKRSASLSAEIYKAMNALNDYGFKDQITRSGLSIPGNIAEGMERRTDKEKTDFLSYVKGSCGELRTQIYIAMKIGYLQKDTGSRWITQTKEISAVLTGLMNSLKVK